MVKKICFIIFIILRCVPIACNAQRNQGWPDLNLDWALDEYRYHANYSPYALNWRFFSGHDIGGRNERRISHI